MKLLVHVRFQELARSVFQGSGFLHILTITILAIPAASISQTLSVDLLKMSQMLEIRYYIADKGEIPTRYILLGGLSIYPNFLETDFDLRQEIVEFDEENGLVYKFRIPGYHRFLRRSQRQGPFYLYTPRDVYLPEMEIELASLDDFNKTIKRKTQRQVWIEDVKYNLKRAREGKKSKGFLSLDIPIHLPKPLEMLIGKGEATNLSLSGRERITIGGESGWCANCPQTEGRPRQNKFPDLDMEQRLTVDLHGNVGERINVGISHSSMGGGMPATNRVRINYQIPEGEEDDIIKLIEMGDTDLTLSGAQLMSYTGGAKGLFGVKVMAQVGPLDLTVIASKEEGETASGSFTSQGGEAGAIKIADYNYIKRQWFYLECPGDSFAIPNPSFNSIYPVIGGIGEDEVEVYVSLKAIELAGFDEEDIYYIEAYADPENNGVRDNKQAGDTKWVGEFKKLVWGKDFGYIEVFEAEDTGDNIYKGITLFQPLDEERALAVCYLASSGDTIGDYKTSKGLTEESRLMAELICPTSEEFGPDLESSPYPSTWRMMLRNIYSLGMSQIDVTSLNVRIEDESRRLNRDMDPTGVSYLRIFGLDSYDDRGEEGKDGRIDYRQGVLDDVNGYIMFPYPEPFNPPRYIVEQILDKNDTTEAKFDYDELDISGLIYDDVLTNQIMDSGHRFNIVVEGGISRRTFQLSAFDIIEGSEVVSVDGTKLTKGIDYEIDYAMGSVSLKGDILNEMTPDSRVSIDYQYKPLVGGGKSSLLGLGANLNLSNSTRINGTFLYNSVGSPKYNPRLGEEPGRMMAADVNGNFQFNPRWMTSLANLLPRVDTDAQSSVNLSAEVALSIPNPNVKGEAFVDDMEGIESSNVISLVRKSWYEASPPLDPFDINETMGPPVDPDSFLWFNPNREAQLHLTTSKRDLNPKLDVRENSSVTSLFLKSFNPDKPGHGNWCGIMTGFSGGIDLITAQYLEIWVNDFQPDSLDRGGILHIDFGMIDEDFYQPDMDSLNDERGGAPDYNWIREQHDTGFRTNDSPKGESCRYPIELSSAYRPPPLDVYEGINCRAGNGIHDSEDMDKNGRLNETNAYYSLELRLDKSADIDIQRQFQSCTDYWNDDERGVGVNKVKAWRMYRLDLSDAQLISPTGAEPRWDAIKHMRMWVERMDSLQGERGPLLEIAQLKFVGNRWEFNGIRNLDNEIVTAGSTDITIGTINNKDNPTYKSPYTVEQEEGIANREQSLYFEFHNLEDSTSFQAVKRFIGQGQDYQQYRELHFFVLADVDTFSCDFYLQVAYDSMNYYEIEVPLTKYDMRKWIGAAVNLGDLTNLKLADTGEPVEEMIHDVVDPGRVYKAKLKGNPTLFKVRYLYAGLRNHSGQTIPRGQVYFNDLRLGGVRRDIGHAERINVTMNFGNIFSFGGGFQRTGPEFRSLRQKMGTGVTNSSLDLSGKTELGYIVPTVGFKLPVSVRYKTSRSLPKYITDSDVEIESEEVRKGLESVENNYGFSVSMSRSGSKNFLMKHLFDNLKAGFSYSKRGYRSPTSRDTTVSMSGNLNYQATFRKTRQLGLFRDIKWRYWLSSFSITSKASRVLGQSYSFSEGKYIKRPWSYRANWDSELSALYDPFESVKINFKASERRNLSVDHNFHGIPIGVRTDYNHSLMLQFQPRGGLFLLSEFNPSFEYNFRYREDLRPMNRRPGDPFGTRNVSGSRDISVVCDFDIGRYALRFGEITHILKKGEGSALAGRRKGKASLEQKKDDFKKWLEESRKPQKSEKAGKQESILGDKPPPTVEGTQQPQPLQPPSGAPKGGEKPESQQRVDLKDLGAKRQGKVEAVPVGQEEKEKPEEADSAAVKRPSPLLLPKHIIQVLARIEPVKVSVKLNRNSYYQRLHEGASLAYQLGLTEESRVPGLSEKAIQNDPLKASGNIVLDLRSGYGITDNLDLDARANYIKSVNEIGSSTSESERFTWPSLTLNWSGIEKVRLLQAFVKQSSMTAKFEREFDKNPTGEITNYRLTPNWSLIWKNSLSTSLAFTYNQKNWMQNRRDMWNKSWSVNLDLKYNLEGSKGLGLPLPFLRSKKVKFKSSVNTGLNLTYMRSMGSELPPSSTLTISPKASYKFTNKMTGSLTMNYSRNAGGIMGYVYHRVGLHITMEFSF